MNVPDDLRYSADHEWARLEDGRVRIGITDYAQDALGDVVYVEVPDVGTSVAAHDKLSEVESTKSVSDLYAPVSAKVVAVNGDLEGSPDLVNSDPYGEGWLAVLDVGDWDAARAGLLDAGQYQDLVQRLAEQEARGQ